ncbi:T-cell surface glycoprotein CD3 zeta chain-like [Pholidichthys leucotaenia]
MWTSGFLVLVWLVSPAEAILSIYDPQLCYIIDGFLALYGIIMTGMFIKEKFFRKKHKEENIYSGLVGQTSGGYDVLNTNAERGRNRRMANDSEYSELNKRGAESEYKELHVKKERQRKNNQVYQDLSSANRDTYDALTMQQLPAR